MAKKQITLAEAKLRQSELQEKAQILKDLSERDIFEIRDIAAAQKVKVPKLSAKQVLHEYDWHIRRVHLLALAIKSAEFLTEVSVDPMALEDYPLGRETKPKIRRKKRAKDQLEPVEKTTKSAPKVGVETIDETDKKTGPKAVPKTGPKAVPKTGPKAVPKTGPKTDQKTTAKPKVGTKPKLGSKQGKAQGK